MPQTPAAAIEENDISSTAKRVEQQQHQHTASGAPGTSLLLASIPAPAPALALVPLGHVRSDMMLCTHVRRRSLP